MPEPWDACQEGISTLSPLAKASPDDVEVQRLIATTEASYANALRLSRKPAEAAACKPSSRSSPWGGSNCWRRTTPSTDDCRPRAEAVLAASLAASGHAAASLDAFRRSVRSMEIAVEIDPSDLGSPLRLAVTLRAFSAAAQRGREQGGGAPGRPRSGAAP